MKKYLNKKFLLLLGIILILSFVYLSELKKEKAINRTADMNHIVVYGSLREEEGKYLLENFKNKYGCTYEYIKLPTEEAVERILDTKGNPEGDIFIGGTCDGYEILKKNDALEPYSSPSANNIPARYKDLRGYWTGFQITPLSIGLNKNLWETEFGSSMKYPTKLSDLLNPEFKGKIILPNPQTSGTGYTLMASLYQELGKEKFIEFIKSLNNNVASTTVSGFNSIQRVASGEYLLTVNFLSDQLIEDKSSNNLVSIVPDNAGWNVDSIALIKGSKHEKMAKKFIDFVLSDYVSDNMPKFSKAISTKKFDNSQFKIYDKYNFFLAAEDRKTIMNILSNLKNSNV
ncbi:ABC transporter substrate-binding protein [Clostridium sp. B9]|uniref:ABC transporter substrate-binding protein n=1 Tax=Clostridium sp. B9 TaxID=3423224 RepID=UPI003D2F3122